ncbi:copper resistance protein B [Acinetobacter sp.]|uniref:copper resistance protein B n=1 Tax=Acinetobacter sp. TaxID=472 RepID=UPI0035B291E8
MNIIKICAQSMLASSVLLMSAGAMAEKMHHGMPAADMEPMPQMDMPQPAANADPMTHAEHQHESMAVQQPAVPAAQAPKVQLKMQSETSAEPAAAADSMPVSAPHMHDHRKEHGGQIYAASSIDLQWRVNEHGDGALKSELESRIGTDENKLFIKVHADQAESEEAAWDAKVLYSRMISDFWDAQIGARYRAETMRLANDRQDAEEALDAVIGLHGLAPYFFETDAYLYAGEDNYSGFSLETERDLLLTQQLIIKPYLELNAVFSDDSKYAGKTGLSHAAAGVETRYEISKKVMPYLDIAYEYDKGHKETAWQESTGSEHGWLYGAGIRFKF